MLCSTHFNLHYTSTNKSIITEHQFGGCPVLCQFFKPIIIW